MIHIMWSRSTSLTTVGGIPGKPLAPVVMRPSTSDHKKCKTQKTATKSLANTKTKVIEETKTKSIVQLFSPIKKDNIRVPDNISTSLQMFEHVSNDTNITKKEIDLPKGNTRSHSIKTTFAESKKQCDINITELHPTSPASLPCTSNTPADPQDMLLDNSRNILPPTAETHSHVVGNLGLLMPSKICLKRYIP